MRAVAGDVTPDTKPEDIDSVGGECSLVNPVCVPVSTDVPGSVSVVLSVGGITVPVSGVPEGRVAVTGIDVPTVARVVSEVLSVGGLPVIVPKLPVSTVPVGVPVTVAYTVGVSAGGV